ncbi:protein kinase [Streptosporangium canum]|uniref:protein kinase domain-containing protein n=1 Tax=Streptosporangium canum TaxID=324952 RepID=UPI0034394035
MTGIRFPYLVMELVEDGTLADLLRQAPPTPNEAGQIVAAVLEALEHSHGREVVHRDIKPANIMVHRAGGRGVPGLCLSRRTFFHIAEAKPSMSIDSVTVTGCPSAPTRSTVSRSGTNTAFAPRSPQELHRVDRAAVRAGRLQSDRVYQREQRRTVGPVVLLQQRQVIVAMMGRHRLMRRSQHLHPSCLLQRLQHQPASPLRHLTRVRRPALDRGITVTLCRRHLLRGGGLDNHRQHVAEDARQPLRFGPMRLPQGLQALAPLLVDRGHPLAEHRHHVIADR